MIGFLVLFIVLFFVALAFFVKKQRDYRHLERAAIDAERRAARTFKYYRGSKNFKPDPIEMQQPFITQTDAKQDKKPEQKQEEKPLEEINFITNENAEGIKITHL